MIASNVGSLQLFARLEPADGHDTRARRAVGADRILDAIAIPQERVRQILTTVEDRGNAPTTALSGKECF